ncbi:MAG: hypothetical protein QM680_02505 [Luteolibacter sp.]
MKQLQALRGKELVPDEIQRALAFLRGEELPEKLGKGSRHWLADELLTSLRMQNPLPGNLAQDLSSVAFQPETDPVVRDYILQHLGHLWEQQGASPEIETALWQGVATLSDTTTPGTSLIALASGYERDQNTGRLAEVRAKALQLAEDQTVSLATRVTALSIAGDSGSAAVKEFAGKLAADESTPLILKKVAERVARVPGAQ